MPFCLGPSPPWTESAQNISSVAPLLLSVVGIRYLVSVMGKLIIYRATTRDLLQLFYLLISDSYIAALPKYWSVCCQEATNLKLVPSLWWNGSPLPLARLWKIEPRHCRHRTTPSPHLCWMLIEKGTAPSAGATEENNRWDKSQFPGHFHLMQVLCQ